MSFMKTLATLAIGIAAAKGFDKFRQGGGMKGMEDTLKNAGAPGGIADQAAELAQKMGIPGGADTVRDMVAKMGSSAADAAAAGQASLGGLMGAMSATAAKGTEAFETVLASLTKGTGLQGMGEDNAKLMIRAMIMAAKADGMIDDDERERIMQHLADASPEELDFVKAEMAAPMDIAGFAASVGAASRQQVYATSLMAVSVDSEAEKTYLRQLAAALGLSDAERDAAHATMGLAPLPA